MSTKKFFLVFQLENSEMSKSIIIDFKKFRIIKKSFSLSEYWKYTVQQVQKVNCCLLVWMIIRTFTIRKDIHTKGIHIIFLTHRHFSFTSEENVNLYQNPKKFKYSSKSNGDNNHYPHQWQSHIEKNCCLPISSNY